MDESVRNNLTSPGIWTRLLYMVLFAIIFSLAEFIFACTVVFQFFAVLLTGHANEPVLKFGNNLSSYLYQVVRYQTFNSEERPFPFSDWPDEQLAADNIWTEAAVHAAASSPDTTATPVAPAAPSEPPPPQTQAESQQNVEPGGQKSDEDRIG
jgi:hypothetical protein